ncbi:signal peptidase II [Frigidibacter sp. RF13]|uniref:signal peptidase II n=1 Tax=Frigidibacter sp. RF13 TaxID=2997340 RepID=UPI0022710057|nr:signal peptidase II [Frigidibacter sp. RF13]MCY1128310.1 signal peptidase II [Frigidibacter sp. RF13]
MRLIVKSAIATFALDQLSKVAVLHVLDLGHRQEIGVLPPFLNFRMAWNEGINFGLFAQSHDLGRWLLILLALAISLWIWRWVRKEPDNGRVQIAGGLLIGGALGNVVDRIVYGAVADFINMGLPGFDNPFSFNLADVAIFLGALGLVAFSRQDRPARTGRDKTP